MSPNTRFVEYCNEKLSTSLITGLPKIANTTNPRRKSFKLFVFFLSIAGFLWQSGTFIQIYLQYPVVQHVTKEYPEVINAPAVTLCNKNRIKRELFCQTLPHECGGNILLRSMKLKPINRGSMKPSVFSDEVYNQSNEFLEALGPQSQLDLVGKCTVERSIQSITCNDGIMIQVPYGGLPYKCFTFFSLIDEPNKDPENVTLSDYYSFRLNLHPEEDMKMTAYNGAVAVSVHDPRSLKNPFTEHMVLRSGYSYRLYVTMLHRQNLPPPYETNCVDYVALWKRNGGRGPLSKKDCMQVCMIDNMMQRVGCVYEAVEYPTNHTLCPLKRNWSLSRLLLYCENSCPEGCEVTDYFMTYEVIDNLKDKLCNATDVHCKKSYVDLEINFNRVTVERLISEPMFASEELFSHIGGYMGLWLGICLITLFDVIEMLVDIIVFSMTKWRKMKSRIVNVTNDKHHA